MSLQQCFWYGSLREGFLLFGRVGVCFGEPYTQGLCLDICLKSLLIVLGELYAVSGIDPEWLSYKIGPLSTELSLHSHPSFSLI